MSSKAKDKKHSLVFSAFISGITGVYLILLIVLGGLATLAHAIFHIVLAAIPEPYGYSFSNCEYKAGLSLHDAI